MYPKHENPITRPKDPPKFPNKLIASITNFSSCKCCSKDLNLISNITPVREPALNEISSMSALYLEYDA